jgi:pyruvate/2-oxoglutarate dehydrogenase complex dihydrolipoamide acyltransferase (E2) component
MTDDRIVPVTMPKWGLSMQLGKITAWVVDEGAEVHIGDDLADIETEKISGTLEAADAGTVRRIVARVGEDVPVSGTIAVIDAGVPEGAVGPEVLTAEAGGRKISYAGVGAGGAGAAVDEAGQAGPATGARAVRPHGGRAIGRPACPRPPAAGTAAGRWGSGATR